MILLSLPHQPWAVAVLFVVVVVALRRAARQDDAVADGRLAGSVRLNLAQREADAELGKRGALRRLYRPTTKAQRPPIGNSALVACHTSLGEAQRAAGGIGVHLELPTRSRKHDRRARVRVAVHLHLPGSSEALARIELQHRVTLANRRVVHPVRCAGVRMSHAEQQEHGNQSEK